MSDANVFDAYLYEMIQNWFRFNVRFVQLLKLWNLHNIVHIYGWWSILFWPLELTFGLMHFIGIGYLLEMPFRINTRPMSKSEIDLARKVFGERINYPLVRLNLRSKLANKFRIAFVTGHVINYHSLIMPPALLIHELTHIYQFEQVGIVYIPRCLFAQASKDGYDFGTLQDHQDILHGTSGIKKLNYEQQAEFLETMFRQQGIVINEHAFDGLDLQV